MEKSRIHTTSRLNRDIAVNAIMIERAHMCANLHALTRCGNAYMVGNRCNAVVSNTPSAVEAQMKAMMLKAFGNMLVAAVAVALALGPGCTKKEEKKETPPAKQAVEPKKEEVKPAEPVKKEEVKPAEPVKKEPTAGEKLATIKAAFPEYSGEPGKVERYLADLKDFAEKNPGTPEAAAATLARATTRTDLLVLAVAEKYPDMTGRLLVADGRGQAGQEPTLDQKAEYYKALAAELQADADKAPAEDKPKYQDLAALLYYMSQDALEAAGKLEGPKLTFPPEWAGAAPAPEAKPTEGVPAEGAPAEAKPAEAKPAEGAPAEGAPAEAKPAEAKPTEGVPAEAAPAEAKPAEGGEAKAVPAAPAGPAAVLVPGGADVSSLFALARSSSPIALRARLLVAARLDEAAKVGQSTVFATRWAQAADAAGRAACGVCGLLGTVPAGHISDVVLLADNSGIVCDKAKGDITAGMPVLDAVRKNCLAEMFLAPEDAALLTPENALVLRVFALAGEFLATDSLDAGDPIAKDARAVFEATRGALQKAAALEPPIEIFKKEEWDLMKDKLVLQSDLSAASPQWEYQPIEVVLFDENGVSRAVRPVADTTGKTAAFADAKEGLRYPGTQIVDLATIQKEIDEKHAGFKTLDMQFDAELGVYLEDVTIRGVKFMKPHYAVPSVITALQDLGSRAGAQEGAAFPYLSGKQVLNSERTGWAEFKDTVGRAALLAVDRQASALLFKRVVDSMYYADGKDDRLLKGPGLASVPTVYFTEKFVDETVLDTTYKRPILVYVTEGGQVRFYPPTDVTRKGKMTAKRHPRKRDVPWRKYSSIEDPRNPDPVWNLFMAYTSANSPKFEEEATGIAAQMKSKWDNGDVFYVVADDNASSGHVVKVADILARLPEDAPIADLAKAFPGLVCDPEKGKKECITNVVVIFPDVEIPYLPGKKKLKEAEINVYCDQKDIAAKIGAKKGAIKFCYDPELQKNPALKGKVTYKFTIDADGKVKTISTEADGLGNSKVVDCAMKIISKISFRRPIGGECVVRYPYMFQP